MEVLDKIKASRFELEEGSSSWSSPSNIAMIKYWGKFDGQIPANPSLSFSLDNCKTETIVDYSLGKSNGVSIDFQFEGNTNSLFEGKIVKYLNVISEFLPFLNDLHLSIKSSNTFPHSSGIASSASSMSALALNLTSIYNDVATDKLDEREFLQFSSFLSRLGSGSACRSIYGGFTIWGKSKFFEGSSDLFAVSMEDEFISPVFNSLCDDILILS